MWKFKSASDSVTRYFKEGHGPIVSCPAEYVSHINTINLLNEITLNFILIINQMSDFFKFNEQNFLYEKCLSVLFLTHVAVLLVKVQESFYVLCPVTTLSL